MGSYGHTASSSDLSGDRVKLSNGEIIAKELVQKEVSILFLLTNLTGHF